MRRPKRIAVHEGSGNVFADVGLDNPDEYLAKAERKTCWVIRSFLEARRL